MNAVNELNDLAEALEESSHEQTEDLQELVELLREAAVQNPVSETAEYLKEEAWSYLR